MMFGPFWWLEPIEYGFHSSKSTQRPSREPDHTRVMVRLRGGAAVCASALCHGVSAAAPAASPAFRTVRRAGVNVSAIFVFPLLRAGPRLLWPQLMPVRGVERGGIARK